MTAEKSCVQRRNTEAPKEDWTSWVKEGTAARLNQNVAHFVKTVQTLGVPPLFHSGRGGGGVSICLSTDLPGCQGQHQPCEKLLTQMAAFAQNTCSLALTKILAGILPPGCPGLWSGPLILPLFSRLQAWAPGRALADLAWPSLCLTSDTHSLPHRG